MREPEKFGTLPTMQTPQDPGYKKAALTSGAAVLCLNSLPPLALPRSGSTGRRWFGHPLSLAPQAPLYVSKV